jgi:hypothetical protein
MAVPLGFLEAVAGGARAFKNTKEQQLAEALRRSEEERRNQFQIGRDRTEMDFARSLASDRTAIEDRRRDEDRADRESQLRQALIPALRGEDPTNMTTEQIQARIAAIEQKSERRSRQLDTQKAQADALFQASLIVSPSDQREILSREREIESLPAGPQKRQAKKELERFVVEATNRASAAQRKHDNDMDLERQRGGPEGLTPSQRINADLEVSKEIRALHGAIAEATLSNPASVPGLQDELKGLQDMQRSLRSGFSAPPGEDYNPRLVEAQMNEVIEASRERLQQEGAGAIVEIREMIEQKYPGSGSTIMRMILDPGTAQNLFGETAGAAESAPTGFLASRQATVRAKRSLRDQGFGQPESESRPRSHIQQAIESALQGTGPGFVAPTRPDASFRRAREQRLRR